MARIRHIHCDHDTENLAALQRVFGLNESLAAGSREHGMRFIVRRPYQFGVFRRTTGRGIYHSQGSKKSKVRRKPALAAGATADANLP